MSHDQNSEKTYPDIVCADSYVGPDRRLYRKSLEEVERHFDSRLIDHEVREMEQIKKYITGVREDIMKAFPDGVEAHRLAHQAQIDAKRAEERFWSELKMDLAKKGLWGIIGILCGMIVLGFGAWVGSLPHLGGK